MTHGDGRRASGPPTLETDRLTMRPIGHGDLDFLADMLGDPRVMRHYPAPLDRTGASLWLQRQLDRYARDGHGFWLVIERASGAPVGQVGLLMQSVEAFGGERWPEIGYLLHATHWGRGFATEAALATRAFAFETRGYPAVISLILSANAPSQAVARRLGMRRVAETIHAGRPHDVWRVDARETVEGRNPVANAPRSRSTPDPTA